MKCPLAAGGPTAAAPERLPPPRTAGQPKGRQLDLPGPGSGGANPHLVSPRGAVISEQCVCNGGTGARLWRKRVPKDCADPSQAPPPPGPPSGHGQLSIQGSPPFPPSHMGSQEKLQDSTQHAECSTQEIFPGMSESLEFNEFFKMCSLS